MWSFTSRNTMKNEHESFLFILLSIHIDLFEYSSFLLAHWVYCRDCMKIKRHQKSFEKWTALSQTCTHGQESGLESFCYFEMIDLRLFHKCQKTNATFCMFRSWSAAITPKTFTFTSSCEHFIKKKKNLNESISMCRWIPSNSLWFIFVLFYFPCYINTYDWSGTFRLSVGSEQKDLPSLLLSYDTALTPALK